MDKTSDKQRTTPLSGDFIAGLAEGEGCFAIKFRRDFKRNRAGSPEYFGWQVLFAIVLRKDDFALLEKVKTVLVCGNLSYSGNSVRLQIQDTKVLVEKIIPFFDQFKLHGKKQKDFELWKEAVQLIARNKKTTANIVQGRRGFIKSRWSKEDLDRLQQIRQEMRQFKSSRPDFKWQPQGLDRKGS